MRILPFIPVICPFTPKLQCSVDICINHDPSCDPCFEQLKKIFVNLKFQNVFICSLAPRVQFKPAFQTLEILALKKRESPKPF